MGIRVLGDGAHCRKLVEARKDDLAHGAVIVVFNADEALQDVKQ